MDFPDVYEYLDHREYLRDWYAAKKVDNPRFSHRAFVRKTGQKSPSLLADVIGGRRNLTPTAARAFCRAMGLQGEEARFFQLLVSFDRAETTTTKNKVWNKISATTRFRQARQLEDASVGYLNHWYFPVIRELARRPDFQEDPGWIAQALHPQITSKQAGDAIGRLFAMGMLDRDADGAVITRDANIMTPPEVRTLAIKNYYRGMLACASDALDTVPSAERHYSTITVAIPESIVGKLKDEINQMTNRIVTMCEEARGDRDQVIQINLNFHPMSNRRSSEET